jgi:hypothetical protein
MVFGSKVLNWNLIILPDCGHCGYGIDKMGDNAEHSSLASVSHILEELRRKVVAAEQTTRQFLLLSREYRARVSASKHPPLYLKFYIDPWFKSYLAFRDEVMVLIQGVVHRRYHDKEHTQFQQDRNSDTKSGCEARFYSNAAYKYLTSCSTDGIKYIGCQNKKPKVGFTAQMLFELIIFCMSSCRALIRS